MILCHSSEYLKAFNMLAADSRPGKYARAPLSLTMWRSGTSIRGVHAATTGITNLPESPIEESLEDEAFLQAFHHALLEVGLSDHSCLHSSWRRLRAVQSAQTVLSRFAAPRFLCQHRCLTGANGLAVWTRLLVQGKYRCRKVMF